MSNQLNIDPERLMARAAVKASLAWSGWGSPVGLAIALVSVGVFLLCLHFAGLVG